MIGFPDCVDTSFGVSDLLASSCGWRECGSVQESAAGYTACTSGVFVRSNHILLGVSSVDFEHSTHRTKRYWRLFGCGLNAIHLAITPRNLEVPVHSTSSLRFSSESFLYEIMKFISNVGALKQTWQYP